MTKTFTRQPSFGSGAAIASTEIDMIHLRSVKFVLIVLDMQFFLHPPILNAEDPASSEVRINHGGSALSNKSNGLASLFLGYALQHNSTLPSTWEQLDRSYSLSHLDTYGGGPIPDNFYLIPNAPVSQVIKSAHIQNPLIVAIGRQPLSELDHEGVGRFVIYRLRDGSFESAWYPEEKIQKIIAETHIVVPPPPAVQPANPYDQPATPATATSPAQASGTSPAPANPSQPAVETPAPLASTRQAPPTSETGIPWWIYGLMVLSIAVIIGAGYYLSKRNGKGP